MNSKKIVEGYMRKYDWRVNENSNAPYSFGALGKYIVGEVSKDYWLREVYGEDIVKAYLNGSIHIHDLAGLTVYCCGYSLKDILLMGVQGVPNIPRSKPAKHFGAVLNQLANLITVFQNEIMGAVAFSSFDTLLAPFIRADKLSYEEVKQHMQNFIFSLNSNSRGGAEPAFSNLTLDLTPPKDLLNDPAVIGGELQEFTFGDCQHEMNLINKAFCEIMLEGDADGEPFAYPIPTYNMHTRFDWDNPNNELLWEMAGKYGYPYFANYGKNSGMDPSDARSMCCRLRLDLKQLQKRNGGLFGSGDSTGSIGVVTINMPRLGYLARGDQERLYELLKYNMDLSRDSLEIKRDYLEDEVLGKGLIPAFSTYVGTLKNHFSTIGVVGLSEMAANFFGDPNKDLLSSEGKQLALDVLQFMREMLVEYQQETGNLYNLEATPAESTCYRLAKIDKKQFHDIITQGTEEAPYYTNSCHIPVHKVTGIKQLFDHQDELQIQFTGGTVVHVYLAGPITGQQAKHIIKTVIDRYRVPYVSLSPVNCYCPNHGHLDEVASKCPKCGASTNIMQRVTGYMRRVEFFNPGKKSEFSDRHQIRL